MAMNVYALCTYYLHPTYDKSKLTADHKGKINAFLLKNLNSQGIEEWDNFMTKSGMYNLFIFRFEITIFVLQEYLLPSQKKILKNLYFFGEWRKWSAQFLVIWQ